MKRLLKEACLFFSLNSCKREREMARGKDEKGRKDEDEIERRGEGKERGEECLYS